MGRNTITTKQQRRKTKFGTGESHLKSPKANGHIPKPVIHDPDAGASGARAATGTRVSTSYLPNNDTMPLVRYFDQVWLITLKRRADRLDRFLGEIEKAKWPFRKPEIFWAIDGDKVGVPKYWQTGGGSYGCLRSHATILERAIQDDIGSVLILEDDAVFDASFERSVTAFLSNVPTDWQCLMLGGQHVNSEPTFAAPGVVRAGGGGGIQRTHCYALRGIDVMKALYRTWANAAVHCDWVMGPCMSKFKTYAPDPFLVGQAEGHSDISARHNPAKFWRSPSGKEPVIILHAPRQVAHALREKGWHLGYTLDPATGIDVGLRDMFTPSSPAAELATRLKNWINMIQWEVLSMTEQAYCTIWHPSVSLDMVRPLVKGKVIEITAATCDEALSQLPADFVIPPTVPITVALLRSSRDTMEELRQVGWHGGHWRDEITGYDNGVRRLLASTKTNLDRCNGLYRIIQALHDEVQEIPNGIVTIWHDEVTTEMMKWEDIEVLEITATTAAEAIAKYKELNSDP